jgi:CRP-like cAMP-binding protein
MSIQVPANEILARLPLRHQEVIHRAGHEVSLEPGRVLHSFGDPTISYFFPITGVVSLTVPIGDEQNVEVGLVGKEGVVGVGSLLGDERHDLNAMAQIRGHGIEVPVSAVAGDLKDALRPLAGRYASSLMLEIAQTAACNRLHSVEQRTARWLLQAGDHARTNEIQLTHEFLAMMLAVRRASVTVVVGVFDRAGYIKAERGRISLADRAGLTEIACDCYKVIRAAAPKYD